MVILLDQSRASAGGASAQRRPAARTASSVAGMVADRRPVLAGCGTICPVPTTGRPISLAHLTVLDATPPELVTVAADAGFRSIGIRLTATPSVGVPPYDALHDGPVFRDTMQRLAGTRRSLLDTQCLRV